MKDIQSVIVMSRQNSGYFGKDIPYLDFDSSVQHETTTSDLMELGAVPGLSMMDWTERLIELATVNDDGQDPQGTVDHMTLITLNVAVTRSADTSSGLSGTLNSAGLDCWQANTMSHRRNTSSVSDDFNIPDAVQTLFNAVYQGRSEHSTSGEALLSESPAIRGVDAYSIPFDHSAMHLSQHSEGGAPNAPQTFDGESLSETLDMYGISKEDLRTDFHHSTNPPVSSAPLVTLSMLLEEDTLCESNKGFNLSTPVSSFTCLHSNTIQRPGDKCNKYSRDMNTEHISNHPKQASYVYPLSANLSIPNLNLSKTTRDSYIDSQSDQRTSAAACKVNVSLCQSNETASNITASSPDFTSSTPDFTSSTPQLNFTVSQDNKATSDNSESQAELIQTPDIKSLPNWEPILLSLTDMDIQSEIEVVENRLTDFEDLNTPTDIPKDALGHQTKKLSISERHLSRQHSHLQKSTSAVIQTYDPNDKPIQSSEGSFFSFTIDDKETLKTQTSQSIDSVSLTTNETQMQCKVQEKTQLQMLLQNMNKRNIHTQNVDNANCSSVNNFTSTFFSKPILSEISSDALLSPGDVDKAFLGCLSTKSYSAQLYSSFDDSTSDISSSISSSLPEAAKQEQTPFSGDNLKIKLRSRLKAKGTAVDSPAGNLSIDTSGSSSTTDNQMSNIPSTPSTRNIYTQKRKSSEHTPEASKAKSVCVSSSSNISETGSSDEEDDIISYFANSCPKRQKHSSGGQEEEEDDEETKLAKREKNRIAAQKCRHKKRDKIESLTRQVQRLENRQDRIKNEVEKLNEEREQLEEMLRVHSFVCQRGQHSDSHKH